MNVKELLLKIIYDKSRPILFIINKKTYTYEEVLNNILLNTIQIKHIKLEAQLSELTDKDIIKLINGSELRTTDVEVILPTNSYHYSIVITIN